MSRVFVAVEMSGKLVLLVEKQQMVRGMLLVDRKDQPSTRRSIHCYFRNND